MGLRPGKPRAARCAVPALRALTPSVLGLARKPREPGLRASGVRFAASFSRGWAGARPVTVLASPALRSRRSARAHSAALRSLTRCAPPAPGRARPAPGLALCLIPRPPTAAPSGLPRHARHAACLMSASRAVALGIHASRDTCTSLCVASAAPRVRPRGAFVAWWRIFYLDRLSHLGVGLSRGYILCPRFSVFQER